MPNNPDRLHYIAVNVGSFDVLVAWDIDEVRTGRGVRLGAQGGSVSLAVDEDGELVTYQAFAIGLGGGSTIYVIETEAQ